MIRDDRPVRASTEWLNGLWVVRRLRFACQRLKASARAGSFLPLLRRKVRFAARAIDQDGVLLLMPQEPSLAFYYAPLAILFVAAGALLGALS